MFKAISKCFKDVGTPWRHQNVVLGSRYAEDVIVSELKHWLVPCNNKLSLGIFSLNSFKDLAHGGRLLGINSFVELGRGFKALS